MLFYSEYNLINWHDSKLLNYHPTTQSGRAPNERKEKQTKLP